MSTLLELARDYVIARETHKGLMRDQLRACVAQIEAGVTEPRLRRPDEFADGVVKDDLGVEIYSRCDEPDGTVTYRRNAETYIAMARATRKLKIAIEALPEAGDPVAVAVRDVFADAKEPWYSAHIDENGVIDPVEKERMDARAERYSAVFKQLKKAVSL